MGLLLGREREVAQIDELLDSASSRRGAVTVVQGPPGIGKTALLAHATSRAIGSGFCVLRGAGRALEREYAFGVVRQLFAPVIARGRSARLFEGAAALAQVPLGLPGVVGADGGGWGDSASAALHGLYWLVVNLTDEGPLLIAVDDAHWVDSMSLRFVSYVAHRLDDLPVLLLVATRPTGDGGDEEIPAQLGCGRGAVTMDPAPLTERDAARLASEAGFADADPAFVSACHRATGGNPFLLGELVDALRDEGVAGAAGDAARLATIAPEHRALGTRSPRRGRR